MRVETDNNMLYDDSDARCYCVLSQAQGHYFAFVQALDLGAPHCRYESPHTKRYWGFWNPDDPDESIRNILLVGGKWPSLPTGEIS